MNNTTNRLSKITAIFSQKDKKSLIFLVLLLIFSALLETGGIGLIMPLIALLNQPEIIDNNKWFNLIYQKSGAQGYHDFLVMISIIMICYYLFKNMFIGFVIYVQSKFLSKKEAEVRSLLLGKYLSMPYTSFLKRNTSELIANINTETTELFFNLVSPALIMLAEILVALFIFALLIIIAPEATIISLIGLGSVSLAFYYLIRKKLSRLGKQRQENISKMIQWVNQSLGSMKELTILGRKGFFEKQFSNHANKFAEANTTYLTVHQLPRLVIESFAVLMLLVVTITILRGEESFIPILSVFAMSAFRLMPSANRITVCAARIKYYGPTLDKIFGDITSFNTPAIKIQKDDSAHEITFERQIFLDNISYTYPESSQTVLENLSLKVKKGGAIGIIGPSGAGKSTLVDILLGLLKPNKGSVQIDGKNIEGNIAMWRKHVSYMPQVIYLTDDTIRRNIALGLDDTEIDEKQILKAIKHAELEAFINSLPDGLETIVGEQGTRLSGGQRQRIGIARSLYNNPDVLILDEATTALDPNTEASICKTLEGMKNDGITLIVISHQHALTSITDKVYTLADKKLK